MTARHARPKGWPRRVLPALDGPVSRTLPVLDSPASPLPDERTQLLRNAMSDDIWLYMRAQHGLSGALEHLAPHPNRGAHRTARRGVRATFAGLRFTADVAKTTGLLSLIVAVPLGGLVIARGLGV